MFLFLIKDSQQSNFESILLLNKNHLKMASLEALAISGIRGYNPQKLQRIDFLHPVTLINGKNGSGKTTIIECLKYVTTGVLPPTARSQKSFVMDPSIAGTPQVRGDIRLRFRTAKNRVVIAKKIMMVSKTPKGLSARAVQQSLKTKDEDGKQIQVTQRCADIEKQIPEMLGISKAILDNIVFCHQDQSLWPFSDNNTLKGIFDQLFDTKKFTKSLENMKDALKDYEKQKTQIKGQLQYIKSGYYRTIQNRTQNLNGLIDVVEASQQLFKIKQQLNPLKQKLKQISSKQSVKNDLISSKGVLQYKIIDLNDRIQKIQQTSSKQNIVLKNIQNQEGLKITKKMDSQILKIEKQIKMLQTLAQQMKDKEATQKRKIQFHMEIKRIKQILPQLNDAYPATSQTILKCMSQKIKIMKKDERKMKDLKQKVNGLIIPSLPMQYQKQDSKYTQQKMGKIKLQMDNIQKKIRIIYNKLYDPNIRQDESGINAESKRAAQKLSKLQAQIQLKKSQLKKYQQMKPRNKSIEQQIYQIRYTGIQLQKQMFEFIRRKKECMLCMKKLNDQDMQDIKTKINKTVKKSQIRIQQLKRNYKPSDDIDPTPIIKEIQSFIDSTNRTMRGLAQEKERYDKFIASQRQIQLNKQLNRLMQGIQLKSSKIKMQNIIQTQSINIQKFRQFINQYKIQASQYKNLLLQSARSKQRSQKIQQIKKQYNIQVQLKKDLQAKIQKLQFSIKNLDIIENIYSKVEQLNTLIKRDQQKGSNSQQSSSQLMNKILHLEDQLRQIKKQKYCIQLSMQHVNLNKERVQLRQRLGLLIQQLKSLNTIKNENNEIQNKKNNLQIQQAKLSQKIKLKKSIHTKYLQEFPPYLIKLLRFNALSSMIADVQTSVKAMQRALNRVHNQKMDQINKILYDIWQQVYHAKDIQFIKINSISQKKSGYGYSIMMKKNGQLIQMKGRCSMGQKVLASLIIRMALAQAFSASTHILALDEPTTNLDRIHIQNLAESISSILQMDQNSRFQLIIISHDMQFISLLRKHTNFYYQITRNQRNFSTIIRKEINQLNQQNSIPRIQAIHY